MLEDKPDPFFWAGNQLILIENQSACWRQQTSKNPEQGTLSASGRSQNAQELLVTDIKRYIVKCEQIAIITPEEGADLF
jgi:hypothetical protein